MISFLNIPEFPRQLLSFLERSLKPVCVYDDRRQTIYASQTFLELLQTETVHPKFFDCFSPALRKKLAKSWQRALQGKASQFTALTRDGTVRVECSLEFDDTAKLMFLTANKMSEIEARCQLTDEKAAGQSACNQLATALSENKKIYSTLLRTEEKWKTLFFHSPYLFIQLSNSGQIIYVSAAVESLLGYQSEELLGRQIKELVHPSHLNELNLALQLWTNQIQTSPLAIECWWRAKSDRWVALFIQGQRFPASLEIDGIMISGHNITARKSLEVELRNNEEKFRSLVINSLGAVFRCDASYMMQLMSDQIQAITRYPASVFVNNQVRSYLSIVHPDDISTLKDSLMQSILDRHCHSIEYRIIDANGDIRWVAERKQGFFAKNGNLLWLDGLLLDISDRKSVEAELSHWKSRH